MREVASLPRNSYCHFEYCEHQNLLIDFKKDKMDSDKLKEVVRPKDGKSHKQKSSKRLKSAVVVVSAEKKVETKSSRSRSLTPDQASLSSRDFWPFSGETNSAATSFARMRKSCYKYLKELISENCTYHDSVVPEAKLKTLSLSLEGNALFTALNIDLYRDSLTQTIKELKSATYKREVHKSVKELLSESLGEGNDSIQSDNFGNIAGAASYFQMPIQYENFGNTAEAVSYSQMQTQYDNFGNTAEAVSYSQMQLQYDNFANTAGTEGYPQMQTQYDNFGNTAGGEGYSQIQTIASERPDYHSYSNADYWEAQYYADPYYGNSNNQNQNLSTSSQSWAQGEGYYYSGYRNNDFTQAQDYWNYGNATQMNYDDQYLTPHSSRTEVHEMQSPRPNYPAECEETHETVESMSKTTSYLEEVSKQSFTSIEKTSMQEKHEQDSAQTTETLSQKDDLENSPHESYRTSTPELRERSEDSLSSRLVKFRELFGIESSDESDTDTRTSEHRRSGHDKNQKHEKVVSSHTLSQADDTGSENQELGTRRERHRSRCSSRLPSWIVKHLMPFYKKEKVVGKKVFKMLGQRISQTIISKVANPNERAVKHYVSKFFPPGMRYLTEQDVCNYQVV